CVKDSRQLSGLIKLFFISAGIVCLLGVLQYFSHRVIFLQEPLSWIGINPYWRWSWRITSTRRHPLVFANNIALYLPLIAAYTAYSRRYLHVTGLILMTVALLLTQSRMPLAAVVFTATAALLIDFRKFKSLFLIGTVTIAVTALVIFLLNTQSYYKNRMNLNLGGRLSMWKDAARLVKENPLFGVGLGNVYENIKSPYSWGGKLSHAHNTYLQILVASGIFALISFLWVIYAFFKEMLRRIKHPDVGKFEKYILVGLLFGFAAEGMCGMTDDLFCRAEIYYPIYFLMGLAMSRALAPKNSQDKK
ncbi:MAG: O-antigen ligase family protein, partial [Candidatus Omnitrophota bacterium]